MAVRDVRWATIARVRLSERIRVVVLWREIDQDIPPDHTIEVLSVSTFETETRILARLGRLLARLKKREEAHP